MISNEKFDVRKLDLREKEKVNEIADIHMDTFVGFFLTFMGKGFLKQMYMSYCEHKDSGVLVAESCGKVIGFLAYSSDFSGLYKYMIKRRLIPLCWYSLHALLKQPSTFMHLVKVFLKPTEVKREEKYVELASIGVEPNFKSQGIGSRLIDQLKKVIDFDEIAYINLETDAKNNEAAICFYEKNGFIKERMFTTDIGREMYEFRYRKQDNQ